MNELKQSQATENHQISPLAKDKTYGEKKFDFIFDKLLNFTVNLLNSAGFSLWATHYTGKVPFMKEGTTPRVMQQRLADAIEQSSIMKLIKDPVVRQERAYARAELLTLLTPGHFIMIPSVWLGAKIKPWFVKREDRKHYGAAADSDPTIQYRHALVEAEAKPTFLGALVGRAGTVVATQITAGLIGTDRNFINKLGERTGIETLANSKGINQYAGQIGDKLGDGLVSLAPNASARVNRWLGEPNFTWSNAQIAAGKNTVPYNRGLQNLVKFTAMDTLYTAVTAGTIRPIMRLLQHVPGMTYRTRPPVDPRIMDATGNIVKVRPPRSPLADSANDNLAAANDSDLVPTNVTTGTTRQLGDRLVAQASQHSKAGG